MPRRIPARRNAKASKIDVGKVVRLTSDALLITQLPDGGRELSTKRATPAAMQGLLLGLAVLTDRANAMLEERHRQWANKPYPQIEADFQAWRGRFEAYLADVNECIGSSRFNDPQCISWTVTLPLLLGWYPNEAGDGVDPAQKVQKTPDLASIFLIFNQLIEAGAVFETYTLGTFMGDVATSAEESYETYVDPIVEAAVAAAKAVAELPQTLMAAAKRHQNTLSALPWILGGGLVVGAIYLAKGGKVPPYLKRS